ncbi:MAG: aminotransferase [Rhodospirillaceae bacterium]|nr:aminotransferase [Rhodospirillaceae bacterium]
MKTANTIFANLGTTVFTVMSALAVEHKSVNLGQGFPDGNGPDDVRAKAAAFLHDQPNQYPPMMGANELRQAVAAHAKRFYGLDVDWREEVLVTCGGTEALATGFFGLIEPGDEVVLIEPLYDSYLPIVRRAGGIPKLVRLTPPHWELPREELAAAFGPKTKAIVVNTPMNPTGKVFTAEELEFIADLVREHDVYAICDEVYEHLTFDGRKHVTLMALPGMRERTLRIGSAGKTFSLTGWKVGYVTAAPALLKPLTKVHQYLTFTTPPNLQRAVAYGLGKDAAYFDTLASDLQRKRDFLADGLREIGFDVLDCQGTYFVNADFRPLGFNGNDVAFCRYLTTDAGVTPIPVSAFYEGPGPDTIVRFAFCKDDTTLIEALKRLSRRFDKAA